MLAKCTGHSAKPFECGKADFFSDPWMKEMENNIKDEASAQMTDHERKDPVNEVASEQCEAYIWPIFAVKTLEVGRGTFGASSPRRM